MRSKLVALATLAALPVLGLAVSPAASANAATSTAHATTAAGATNAARHPKITVAVDHRTVRPGARVRLTGRVSPRQHGQRVHLQRFYRHAWHTTRTTKLSGSSHYSFTVKAGSAGTYRYRVHESRAAHRSAASSRTVTVTVRRASSGGSCHPRTSGGNCYEPGEFCRASDHGASGVAGNGEAITCRDDNGWRWVAA